VAYEYLMDCNTPAVGDGYVFMYSGFMWREVNMMEGFIQCLWHVLVIHFLYFLILHLVLVPSGNCISPNLLK